MAKVAIQPKSINFSTSVIQYSFSGAHRRAPLLAELKKSGQRLPCREAFVDLLKE
jgi:hypothetical protein